MTPAQVLEIRLRDIRARVRRFRAMTIQTKMAAPGFAYGCMADESLLLDLYDGCMRERARLTPAAPIPAIPGEAQAGTAPTASDRFDAGWNAAVVAAASSAEASLIAAVRAGLNPYQTRARVAADLAALEHIPPVQRLPTAPLPPSEPPPFTA